MRGQHAREDWIAQHFMRAGGPGGVLEPFSQVVAAADVLAHVATDRVGLARYGPTSIGTIAHQAVVLGDFARALRDDSTAMLRSAELAPAAAQGDEAGRALRARTLMHALSGAVESTATLIEVAQALLGVAESLQSVQRPKGRIELVAAVEGLRAGAATAYMTAEVNLDRITDAVKFDRLARRITAIDDVLDRSDRLVRSLRARHPAPNPKTGAPAPAPARAPAQRV